MMPELPDGWSWEAAITDRGVSVRLQVLAQSKTLVDGYQQPPPELVTIAKRSVEKWINPESWESVIVEMAEIMWADYMKAAELSVNLGIQVMYE